MLVKTTFSLLAFCAIRVQASTFVSLVGRSSLEILASRQTTTGVCTDTCAPFSNAVDSCTTKACLCTAAVANSLQVCINCAVNASPTTSVISAAQSLIDTYKSTCAGVISPVLTIPSGVIPSTTAATIKTTPVTIATPTTTRAVVTTVSTVPNLTQTVIGPSDTGAGATPARTTGAAATSGVPGLTGSASRNSIQKASVVAFGAMVGAALVL